MRLSRDRSCPACGDETMRRDPPAGLKGASALVAGFTHWRRCRGLVLTLLPDSAFRIGFRARVHTTVGKRCPSCKTPTQRVQTPSALRARKRLLLGLATYRKCWECGWNGLAVHHPRLLGASRG